ncbi:unnamed protein product [Polarella glacialis]|uniref:Uncharacterized protein n=1 Tax=Polarella glacialis TaxID=89957 RepID=A0A813KW90_POLGL|nr:unnamed protein product [Polarella glacialis]
MAALQDSLGMNWRSHNKDLVNDSFGPAWRKASTSPLQEGSLPLHPMERKELLCRVLHLRAPEVEKLRDSDYMEQHGYSLSVCPLPTDVAFSGKGAERGFVVRVYYEAHREARLLPALQTLGVDLGAQRALRAAPAAEEPVVIGPPSQTQASQTQAAAQQQKGEVKGSAVDGEGNVAVKWASGEEPPPRVGLPFENKEKKRIGNDWFMRPIPTLVKFKSVDKWHGWCYNVKIINLKISKKIDKKFKTMIKFKASMKKSIEKVKSKAIKKLYGKAK